LAADTKRLEELNEAARGFLAWQWIAGRVEELNLSPQQARQVELNRARNNEAVTQRIAQTYIWIWALVPEQPDSQRPPVLTAERSDGAKERLAERVTDKLTRAGLLAGQIAARSIRLTWINDSPQCGIVGISPSGSSGPTTAATRTSPGYATARCSTTGFAQRYSSSPGRWTASRSPTATTRQPADTRASSSLAATPTTARLATPRSWYTRSRHSRRFEKSRTARLTLTRARIAKPSERHRPEILQQLTAVDGVDLDVTVEVQVRCAAGFPEGKVRTVMENAKTLKFTQSGFEDD
jgi:hypothetical protein